MLNFPTGPTVGQAFTGGGSSWVWDGVKWEGASDALSVVTVTPAPGDTIVLTSQAPLYVNNVTTLASLTVRLPATTGAPQFAQLGFRSPVTALSIQSASGAVIAGAANSAYGPGAAIVMYYVDNTIGWILWK